MCQMIPFTYALPGYPFIRQIIQFIDSCPFLSEAW